MNVLTQLSVLEKNSAHQPTVIRLTMLKVNDRWHTENLLSICMSLENTDAADRYSVKRFSRMIDAFLKKNDRLCWKDQQDADLFLFLATKHLEFRVAKNSIILPLQVPQIQALCAQSKNVSLFAVRRLLEELKIHQDTLQKSL